MYLDFFALERHPFRITPDPSLFFHGGSRGRGVVLDALVYAITTGEGILKVVGEVGSGKTMLCRMLEECLPDTVEIVYLANPNLSARDIIYAVAFELRLDVDAASDRLVVMQRLQDYLLKRHGEGASVVVFIEEAQSMPLDTLEEVRLLSNLETHRHKLMQIVLFGQPELDVKLQHKSIRQLKERITHSFNLEPLTPEEIREYLHFRLKVAGCPWPQLFSPQAEKQLIKASSGLTRRINILADKSLLAAYADPATRPQLRNGAGEIQPMVQARHVKVAIADSAYRTLESPPNGWQRYLGYALTLGAGIAIGAVLWWWRGPAVHNSTQSLETSAALLAPVAAQPAGAVPGSMAQNAGAQNPAVVPGANQESVTAQGTATPLSPPVAESAATPSAAGKVTMAAPSSSTATAPTAAAPRNAALTPARLPVPAADTVLPTAPASAVQRSLEPEELRPEPGVEDVVAGAAVAALTPERVTSAASAMPAAATNTAEPAPASNTALERQLPRVGTLAASRLEASAQWLDMLAGKAGYSIQMFAAATGELEKLEDYLGFLALDGRINQVYLCLLSGNSRRPEQWLVFYGEFAGLSTSHQEIEGLSAPLRQYAPYARNLNGIACANTP